jgi:hypothetical protein
VRVAIAIWSNANRASKLKRDTNLLNSALAPEQ